MEKMENSNYIISILDNQIPMSAYLKLYSESPEYFYDLE